MTDGFLLVLHRSSENEDGPPITRVRFPKRKHQRAEDDVRCINRCPRCVYTGLHSLCERLTVPEENSNDDRHMEQARTNHIVNFSSCALSLLSLSLSFAFSLSSFQYNTTHKKKRRGEKKKEAAYKPTSLYRRHRHTRSSHHLASRSDHLHVYDVDRLFVVIATLLLRSSLLLLLTLLSFDNYELADSILPTVLVVAVRDR